MRKKELLTAILCITLTICIIGIVMKSGNKQHPDVLHNNTEVEKSEMDEMQANVQLHPYRVYIEQEKRLFAFEQEDEEIEILELDDLEEEMGMAEEHMEDDVDDPTHETEHQQTERSTPPAQVNQSGSAHTKNNQSREKTNQNKGKGTSGKKNPPRADSDDKKKDEPKDNDSKKPAPPENEEQEKEPEPEPDDVEESDPEPDPDPEDGEEDDEKLEE